MTNIRKQGFRAGYHSHNGTPIPKLPRYLIHAADRTVWLEEWAKGRALARRHLAELNSAVERLNEEQLT